MVVEYETNISKILPLWRTRKLHALKTSIPLPITSLFEQLFSQSKVKIKQYLMQLLMLPYNPCVLKRMTHVLKTGSQYSDLNKIYAINLLKPKTKKVGLRVTPSAVGRRRVYRSLSLACSASVNTNKYRTIPA